MLTALMRNIVKQLTIVLMPLAMFANLRQALAEWSMTTSGALYYTDDVGIFSATRRLAREVTESLEVRLLARYGTRLYNDSYSQRDTNFWTVGPHLEWQIMPSVRFVLSYHFERGLAQGRHEPDFEEDVSYVNHFISTDLEFELSERFSLFTAFHYEYNDWLSSLEGDERNGTFETVAQGEVLLRYLVSDITRAYLGLQYSRRKESFEAESIENINVGIGLETTF